MVFHPAIGHHRAPVPRDEAPRAPPREVSTGALPRPHVLDAFPSLDPSRVAPPPRPPPRERRLAPSRRARLIGALDVQPVRHPALHLAPNLERHLCAPPSRLARVIRRSPLERRPVADVDPATQALSKRRRATTRGEPARGALAVPATAAREDAPSAERAGDPRGGRRRLEAIGQRRSKRRPRRDARAPSPQGNLRQPHDAHLPDAQLVARRDVNVRHPRLERPRGEPSVTDVRETANRDGPSRLRDCAQLRARHHREPSVQDVPRAPVAAHGVVTLQPQARGGHRGRPRGERAGTGLAPPPRRDDAAPVGDHPAG